MEIPCLALLMTLTLTSANDFTTQGMLEMEDIRGPIRNGIVILKQKRQQDLWNLAKETCMKKMTQTPLPSDGRVYCPRTWDNIMCWPDTPAGDTAQLPCAAYINKFNIRESATKVCTDNGTWFVHPFLNNTWTNFTQCFSRESVTDIRVSPLYQEHLPRLVLMFSIGYALSLLALTLAVIILLAFKKLHCPRNTVHINLFAAFILRALMSLLKESLMVDGLGFEMDIIRDADNLVAFNPEGSHWQCKLFMTVYYYALAASLTWVFVEGLYLHTLLFVTVFTERSSVHWYIAFGWAAPVFVVIPWALVRIYFEDTMCWNMNANDGFVWIIMGPVSITLAINFIFFLNIFRVLFTKLMASNTRQENSSRHHRLKRLARSVLVLVPLCGVHFLAMVFIPESDDPKIAIVQLYIEMFFNSFQGFLVSMLVCFLNGEVQGELRKKKQRILASRRRNSIFNRVAWTSISSYLSRARYSLQSIHSTERAEVPKIANGKLNHPRLHHMRNSTLGGAIRYHLPITEEEEPETEPMVTGTDRVLPAITCTANDASTRV